MFSKIFCKNIKYNSIPFGLLAFVSFQWLFFPKLFVSLLELTFRTFGWNELITQLKSHEWEENKKQCSRQKCTNISAITKNPLLKHPYCGYKTTYHDSKYLLQQDDLVVCDALYADFVSNRNIFMFSIFVMRPLNSDLECILHTKSTNLFHFFDSFIYTNCEEHFFRPNGLLFW